ncbi:MAG: RDD family protein, partial [Nitriliruptorales bacterium]|nr:RDD family protein [Nitriliruptorales bacterium]
MDDAERDASGRERPQPVRLDLTGRLGRLTGQIAAGVVDGIDPDEIVAQVDVQALVERIDPDEIVARIDVNALLDRVEVNDLLDRVDVDRLLDRVDVDRFLERVDVEALVRRAGIPEIVAESTGQVAGSAIDLFRRQAVGLDVIVMRALLRMTGKDPAEVPAGPNGLIGDSTGQASVPTRAGPGERDEYEVAGHYAGLLSRLAAYVGDVAAVFASWTAISAGLAYLGTAVFGIGGGTQGSSTGGLLWIIGLLVWGFLYFWVSTAIVGRTPGMAVLGLRIVSRQGAPLRPRSALIRVLVLPISALPFGAGFLGIVLDRERRALHDVAAGSAVVYDW